MKTTPWLVTRCAFTMALAFACERGPELEPAQTGNEAEGLESAVTGAENGVRITAQAIEWPGYAEISDEVTPLRLTIENDSGMPVLIKYENFRLVADDGTEYRALPPFNIVGTADIEPEVVASAPLIAPDFYYEGFYVAAPYREVYPDLEPYGGVMDLDYNYYDTYYPYWGDIEVSLPTPEMLRRALPEGSLSNGGRVTGFLYFQKVDDDEGRVNLSAEVTSPDAKKPPARIDLAFVTD